MNTPLSMLQFEDMRVPCELFLVVRILDHRLNVDECGSNATDLPTRHDIYQSVDVYFVKI